MAERVVDGTVEKKKLARERRRGFGFRHRRGMSIVAAVAAAAADFKLPNRLDSIKF